MASLDIFRRPDALVYYDTAAQMAYVVYRTPYSPLGDPRQVNGLVKDRLAWPWVFVERAVEIGHSDFLYDARWRASNATLVHPHVSGTSFCGWVAEESARAARLVGVLRAAGVEDVFSLLGMDKEVAGGQSSRI